MYRENWSLGGRGGGQPAWQFYKERFCDENKSTKYILDDAFVLDGEIFVPCFGVMCDAMRFERVFFRANLFDGYAVSARR
jgi:hypothetical protein